MFKQKALYYPGIMIESLETRFGVQEVNVPTLYDTPIEGKYIVKVDILDILKDIWGQNILMSRKFLYTIVSGNCSDEEYKQLICSYYIRFSSFCNYVTEKFVFGDDTTPLIQRIIVPAKAILDKHSEEVCDILKASGGKFLLASNYYVYYAFRNKEQIPQVRGAIVIC